MRTGVIARRISLRRKPQRDPVTREVWNAVMDRDQGICFAYRVDGPAHRCQGPMGVDHVLEDARMGKRAPSDPAHLVAMCWDANVNGWASAHRTEERAYLAAVSEPEHTHVDPQPGCVQCFEVWG